MQRNTTQMRLGVVKSKPGIATNETKGTNASATVSKTDTMIVVIIILTGMVVVVAHAAGRTTIIAAIVAITIIIIAGRTTRGMVALNTNKGVLKAVTDVTITRETETTTITTASTSHRRSMKDSSTIRRPRSLRTRNSRTTMIRAESRISLKWRCTDRLVISLRTALRSYAITSSHH